MTCIHYDYHHPSNCQIKAHQSLIGSRAIMDFKALVMCVELILCLKKTILILKINLFYQSSDILRLLLNMHHWFKSENKIGSSSSKSSCMLLLSLKRVYKTFKMWLKNIKLRCEYIKKVHKVNDFVVCIRARSKQFHINVYLIFFVR